MEQTTSIVSIEKLVFGGLGLARTEWGVVFVSDVLPGEKVTVVMDGTVGGQMRAFPVAIIEASPRRRKPPCAYYGACGGCDLLHCSYELQLSSKKEMVSECLARIGKIRELPDMEVIASPEFGYRQRAQCKVDGGRKTVGLYKRKSREVVAIRHCPLLMPALNALLARSEEMIASLPGSVDQIKLVAGKDGSVASSPALPGLCSATTIVRAGRFDFQVSGDSFFQGNAYLCEKLGIWARPSVQGDCFADVYGGVGFFSAFFHDRFSSGVIVDALEQQVDLARSNLKDNGITNVASQVDTAERFLLGSFSPAIDCLIVDPPRQGLSASAREGILRRGPATILYVSCNPSTQARDLGVLLGRSGYFIDRLALFDLYPNTHHVETAALLRKR